MNTKHFSTVKRFSIDGWKIRYSEPNLGEHEFKVTTHKALAEAKAWLDAGGYPYSVREIS